jgi:hypothetical protein
MTETTTVPERPRPGDDAPYEPPTVTPVGNLNDLLLGATGPLCDQLSSTGGQVNDGTCG